MSTLPTLPGHRQAPCRWCQGTGQRIRLGRRAWNWTHSNK